MKIIKPPTDPRFTSVRFECSDCGTIFEADPEERKSHYSEENDAYYWRADCPTCAHDCWESR